VFFSFEHLSLKKIAVLFLVLLQFVLVIHPFFEQDQLLLLASIVCLSSDHSHRLGLFKGLLSWLFLFFYFIF
jgi:hypothetical protein